jgi:uncharacterized protein (TIGR03435 family)
MMRALGCLGIIAFLSGVAFSQPTESKPTFELVDIHPSPHGMNQFSRGGAMRGGRLELRYATMVDLISRAYGIDAEKVLGGPNWLELDRFDVIAKSPADSSPKP